MNHQKLLSFSVVLSTMGSWYSKSKGQGFPTLLSLVCWASTSPSTKHVSQNGYRLNKQSTCITCTKCLLLMSVWLFHKLYPSCYFLYCTVTWSILSSIWIVAPINSLIRKDNNFCTLKLFAMVYYNYCNGLCLLVFAVYKKQILPCSKHAVCPSWIIRSSHLQLHLQPLCMTTSNSQYQKSSKEGKASLLKAQCTSSSETMWLAFRHYMGATY